MMFMAGEKVSFVAFRGIFTTYSDRQIVGHVRLDIGFIVRELDVQGSVIPAKAGIQWMVTKYDLPRLVENLHRTGRKSSGKSPETEFAYRQLNLKTFEISKLKSQSSKLKAEGSKLKVQS